MTGHHENNERRKEPRFLVNERALAFVGKKYGKIIDINSKGLSFQYIVKENRPLLTNDIRKTCITLDISSSTYDFCLTDVPVKIISEREIKPNNNSHPTLRTIRCGVEFKDLTPYQIFYLKRFVLNNQYNVKH